MLYVDHGFCGLLLPHLPLGPAPPRAVGVTGLGDGHLALRFLAESPLVLVEATLFRMPVSGAGRSGKETLSLESSNWPKQY